jgi:hypothetical protein
VRSLLIKIKRIKRSHTEKNIAEIIILIIKKMVSSDQISFFIRDNAASNNTVIRAILTYLRPDIKDASSRRVRYINYIINLAVKAFLFKKDADYFEKES